MMAANGPHPLTARRARGNQKRLSIGQPISRPTGRSSLKGSFVRRRKAWGQLRRSGTAASRLPRLMFSLLLMVGVGAGTLTAAAPSVVAAPATPRPLGQVVPEPASVQPAGAPFTLGPHASIGVPFGSLQAARVGGDLAALLRPSTGYALPVTFGTRPGGITLRLGRGDGLGAEGYRLDVRRSGVVIEADAAAGLFHGVQTLRQLLPAAVEARTLQQGPWTVAGGTITDTPRYAYRGAMLDVVPALLHRRAGRAVHRPAGALQDQLPASAPVRRPGLAHRGHVLAAAGHVRRQHGGRRRPGRLLHRRRTTSRSSRYAAARFMTVVPEIDMPGPHQRGARLVRRAQLRRRRAAALHRHRRRLQLAVRAEGRDLHRSSTT